MEKDFKRPKDHINHLLNAAQEEAVASLANVEGVRA